MQTLLCFTGNKEKFSIGKSAFERHGVQLRQIVTDIDEVQSEDGDYIIREKAKRAFEEITEPLIVTDDSWTIPGLNGFPGPYMKSITHWFSAKNFVNLTSTLSDRTIYINQRVAYIDSNEIVIFSSDISGTMATSPRGTNGPSIRKIVCLDAYPRDTLSELDDKGIAVEISGGDTAWYQLARWYTAKQASS